MQLGACEKRNSARKARELETYTKASCLFSKEISSEWAEKKTLQVVVPPNKQPWKS